jgi:hypothetical protein
MLEELPIPTEEQRTLRSIAALIKNYEPRFDLQRSFTPGVLGCSDPQYPAIKSKWFDDSVRKGLADANALVAQRVINNLPGNELGWQESEPADSRFNWRVTVHHDNYFIHIMALDKNFERFAYSLQTEGDFEEGLTSIRPRPANHGYRVVNRLSELKPFLDDLYENLKRERQENRTRERINKAVAEEREKWETRLAKERETRRQIVYFWTLIAVLLVGAYVASTINKHFHGVPENVFFTALGAGLGALFGTLLFLWGVWSLALRFGLLKDGKPAPPLLMLSALIVFFVLWLALFYAAFGGPF